MNDAEFRQSTYHMLVEIRAYDMLLRWIFAERAVANGLSPEQAEAEIIRYADSFSRAARMGHGSTEESFLADIAEAVREIGEKVRVRLEGPRA